MRTLEESFGAYDREEDSPPPEVNPTPPIAGYTPPGPDYFGGEKPSYMSDDTWQWINDEYDKYATNYVLDHAGEVGLPITVMPTPPRSSPPSSNYVLDHAGEVGLPITVMPTSPPPSPPSNPPLTLANFMHQTVGYTPPNPADYITSTYMNPSIYDWMVDEYFKHEQELIRQFGSPEDDEKLRQRDQIKDEIIRSVLGVDQWDESISDPESYYAASVRSLSNEMTKMYTNSGDPEWLSSMTGIPVEQLISDDATYYAVQDAFKKAFKDYTSNYFNIDETARRFGAFVNAQAENVANAIVFLGGTNLYEQMKLQSLSEEDRRQLDQIDSDLRRLGEIKDTLYAHGAIPRALEDEIAAREEERDRILRNTKIKPELILGSAGALLAQAELQSRARDVMNFLAENPDIYRQLRDANENARLASGEAYVDMVLDAALKDLDPAIREQVKANAKQDMSGLGIAQLAQMRIADLPKEGADYFEGMLGTLAYPATMTKDLFEVLEDDKLRALAEKNPLEFLMLQFRFLSVDDLSRMLALPQEKVLDFVKNNYGVDDPLARVYEFEKKLQLWDDTFKTPYEQLVGAINKGLVSVGIPEPVANVSANIIAMAPLVAAAAAGSWTVFVPALAAYMATQTVPTVAHYGIDDPRGQIAIVDALATGAVFSPAVNVIEDALVRTVVSGIKHNTTAAGLARLGTQVTLRAGINVAEDVPVAATVLALQGVEPGSPEWADALKETALISASVGGVVPVSNALVRHGVSPIVGYMLGYSASKYGFDNDEETSRYIGLGLATAIAIGMHPQIIGRSIAVSDAIADAGIDIARRSIDIAKNADRLGSTISKVANVDIFSIFSGKPDNVVVSGKIKADLDTAAHVDPDGGSIINDVMVRIGNQDPAVAANVRGAIFSYTDAALDHLWRRAGYLGASVADINTYVRNLSDIPVFGPMQDIMINSGFMRYISDYAKVNNKTYFTRNEFNTVMRSFYGELVYNKPSGPSLDGGVRHAYMSVARVPDEDGNINIQEYVVSGKVYTSNSPIAGQKYVAVNDLGLGTRLIGQSVTESGQSVSDVAIKSAGADEVVAEAVKGIIARAAFETFDPTSLADLNPIARFIHVGGDGAKELLDKAKIEYEIKEGAGGRTYHVVEIIGKDGKLTKSGRAIVEAIGGNANRSYDDIIAEYEKFDRYRSLPRAVVRSLVRSEAAAMAGALVDIYTNDEENDWETIKKYMLYGLLGTAVIATGKISGALKRTAELNRPLAAPLDDSMSVLLGDTSTLFYSKNEISSLRKFGNFLMRNIGLEHRQENAIVSTAARNYRRHIVDKSYKVSQYFSQRAERIITKNNIEIDKMTGSVSYKGEKIIVPEVSPQALESLGIDVERQRLLVSGQEVTLADIAAQKPLFIAAIRDGNLPQGQYEGILAAIRAADELRALIQPMVSDLTKFDFILNPKVRSDIINLADETVSGFYLPRGRTVGFDENGNIVSEDNAFAISTYGLMRKGAYEHHAINESQATIAKNLTEEQRRYLHPATAIGQFAGESHKAIGTKAFANFIISLKRDYKFNIYKTRDEILKEISLPDINWWNEIRTYEKVLSRIYEKGENYTSEEAGVAHHIKLTFEDGKSFIVDLYRLMALEKDPEESLRILRAEKEAMGGPNAIQVLEIYQNQLSSKMQQLKRATSSLRAESKKLQGLSFAEREVQGVVDVTERSIARISDSIKKIANLDENASLETMLAVRTKVFNDAKAALEEITSHANRVKKIIPKELKTTELYQQYAKAVNDATVKLDNLVKELGQELEASPLFYSVMNERDIRAVFALLNGISKKSPDFEKFMQTGEQSKEYKKLLSERAKLEKRITETKRRIEAIHSEAKKSGQPIPDENLKYLSRFEQSLAEDNKALEELNAKIDQIPDEVKAYKEPTYGNVVGTFGDKILQFKAELRDLLSELSAVRNIYTKENAKPSDIAKADRMAKRINEAIYRKWDELITPAVRVVLYGSDTDIKGYLGKAYFETPEKIEAKRIFPKGDHRAAKLAIIDQAEKRLWNEYPFRNISVESDGFRNFVSLWLDAHPDVFEAASIDLSKSLNKSPFVDSITRTILGDFINVVTARNELINLDKKIRKMLGHEPRQAGSRGASQGVLEPSEAKALSVKTIGDIAAMSESGIVKANELNKFRAEFTKAVRKLVNIYGEDVLKHLETVKRLESQLDILRQKFEDSQTQMMQQRQLLNAEAEAAASKSLASEARITRVEEDLVKKITSLEVQAKDLERMKARLERISASRGSSETRIEDIRNKIDMLNEEITTLRNNAEKYKTAARNLKMELTYPKYRVLIRDLSQLHFDKEIADAINREVEAKRFGSLGEFFGVTSTIQGIMKGIQATADISFLGITGLLATYRHPQLALSTMRTILRRLADPETVTKYLDNYDLKAKDIGAPTVNEWVSKYNLHFAVDEMVGADDISQLFRPDSKLLKFAEKLQNLPLIKQSSAAFGLMGNIFRLEMARLAWEAEYSPQMTPNQRHALARLIAEEVNKATGYSDRPLGDIGGPTGMIAQNLQFAARWNASKFGLIKDALADTGYRGASAREMLIRIFGLGALMTVAFNDMLGNDTDFDPTSPNFLTIRVGDHDVSLLGQWGSLVRGLVNTIHGVPPFEREYGDVMYIPKSMTSPLVGLFLDIRRGETITGGELDGWYALSRIMPFSTSTIVSAIKRANDPDYKKDNGEIDAKKAIMHGLVSFISSLTGLKATPMSSYERYVAMMKRDGVDIEDPLQVREWKLNNIDKLKAIDAKKTAEYAEKQSMFILKKKKLDQEFESGKINLGEYMDKIRGLNEEWYDENKREIGDYSYRNASDKMKLIIEYRKINEQSVVDGVMDYELRDALLNEFRQKYGDDALDYVEKYMLGTKGKYEQLYSVATYALSRININGQEVNYFDIPRVDPKLLHGKPSWLTDEEYQKGLERVNDWASNYKKNLGKSASKVSIDDIIKLNAYNLFDTYIPLPPNDIAFGVLRDGWSREEIAWFIYDAKIMRSPKSANPLIEEIRQKYPFLTRMFDKDVTYDNLSGTLSENDREILDRYIKTQ